jgi:iron complex outermembrane receptor protein
MEINDMTIHKKYDSASRASSPGDGASPLVSGAIAMATCALTLAVQNVNAQQASMPVLEETVVTAEKREQSLQDVPISIVAMGVDTLEKFGIDEIEDIGAKVPNVITNEYFGIATTFRSFIRGVGAVTVEVTQDPAVALYTDGIYVGSSFGGSFEASDLERIEILRGPQGTLYGRNATGGAINLISRKPEIGEFTFSQSLTAGDYGRFKSNTGINVPLGDSTAARLSLLVSERDGLVENTGVGDDWGKEDRTAGRLALRTEPTDTLLVDFAAEVTKIKDTARYSQVLDGYAKSVAGTGTPVVVPLGPPGAPVANIYYPDPITDDRLDKGYSIFDVQPDDNTVWGSSLTVAWELSDNMQFKSITGYRDVDAKQFTQVTGTVQTYLEIPGVPFPVGPSTLGTGGEYRQKFTQVTQEFQLIGDTDFMGGDVEYVSGIYYYYDDSKNEDLSASISGQKLPGTDETETENKSIAVYGQGTYTPAGSAFHITVGARYSDDQRKAVRNNTNSSNPFIDTQYKKDFSNFSPSLTVAYDLTDYVNIYGSVVTGYRSGGTSTLSYEDFLFQEGADEETIISYEIGIKGEYWDRRVRLNAAVFDMEYQDYQGSIQTGPTPADRDNLNLGDATIRGAELDLTALLSESFTLTLAGGYLDSSLGKSSIDPDTGAPPTPLVDELPYAPELSYNASLDYAHDVFNGLLFEANINYYYQDESESGIVVGTSNRNDKYGLLDASVSLSQFRLANGDVKLTLWGRNLTDEEYAVSDIGAFKDFGASGISPFGDPRTYGVTVSYVYE